MRLPKLNIAGPLVLLLLAFTSADWNEEPFLKPIIEHENVTWDICTIETNCATINLKENTESEAELLRLNTAEKPELAISGVLNVLGVEIGEDDKTPKFFLRATKPGDYEEPINRGLATLRIPPQDTYYTVVVRLENVNDNPPIIQSHGDCSFEEEKLGTPDCFFTVTDYDGSACYAELTSTDEHFTFSLQGNQTRNCKVANYDINVVQELDYESNRFQLMKITAEDRGQVGPAEFLEPEVVLRTSIPFAVKVVDIPDESPVWQKLITLISIDEKNFHKEQFVAVDGDFGLNWEITYGLEVDTEFNDYFAIDSSTGMLYIWGINRDSLQQEIFIVRIFATEIPQEPWLDYKPLSVYADLVVVVNDINDNLPFLTPSNIYFQIDEEMAFSSKIFTVDDPDLGLNGTFNVTLNPNAYSSNFILVPYSGYQTASLILTARDASKMDYEDPMWRNFALQIVAQELQEESHYSVAVVNITLNNLNDEYPVFSVERYEVFVEENRPKDFSIVYVSAEDPDEGDWVTYSLQGYLLDIDGVTGAVTTNRDLTFDYETQTEIILQVYADDQATPTPHRGLSQIVINIMDLNDEVPVLNVGDDIGPVEEHSEKGTTASPEITATDPDTTADLKITIDWEESVAYKQGFIVDKELFKDTLVLAEVEKMENDDGTLVWKTHVIVNDNEGLDWEIFEHVRLKIQVEDVETHYDYLDKKYAYSTIFINVGDINDQEPQFTEASSTVEAVENERLPRLLGSVLAIDLDGPPYNVIKYYIEPVFPEGLKEAEPQVEINEDTGRISTTSTAFDVEEFRQMEYKYVIYATDGKFTNEHQLTVNIADINDEIPEYSGGIDPNKLTQEYEEHKEGVEELVCLGGHDNDMTDPFNHITYIIENNQDDFHMVDDCFYVTNGATLDREDIVKGPVRKVTVGMRDNFKKGIKLYSNEGEYIIITVSLIDINDNNPEFEQIDKPIAKSEISQAGILFTVGVTDKDEGDNARIKCSEKPTVNVKYPSEYDEDEIAELFVVLTDEEKSTCSVWCTKPLRGFWGQYELTLEAYDHGALPLSTHQTYSLHIESFNFNFPVIVYPTHGQIIRINRYEENLNWQPLVDYYGEILPDFYASDNDDPETDNGMVDFQYSWECDVCGGVNYFDFIVSNLPQNTIRLRKLSTPPDNVRIINGKLTATDRGKPSLQGSEIYFKILIIDSTSVPQFPEKEFHVQFTENITGLMETQTFPSAVNLGQEGLPEEEKGMIYYHFVDGGDLFSFNDCKEPTVYLKVMLDYEQVTEHIVKVAATHDAKNCDTANAEVHPGSLLNLIVEVIDVNDEPPRFSQNIYMGLVNQEDKIGQIVTTLLAYDPDVDDEITYEIIPGTITASASLEEIASDSTFLVNSYTGIITLNTTFDKDVSGYFEFSVVAYDLAGNVDGHKSEVNVRVYVS